MEGKHGTFLTTQLSPYQQSRSWAPLVPPSLKGLRRVRDALLLIANIFRRSCHGI